MPRCANVNDESDQLKQLALAVQQQPHGSAARRIALNRLICAIVRSGKLFCRGRYNFPPEVYDEALSQTLLYISKNIDRYDPTKAGVMTWVNKILHFKFIDAIARYTKQQKQLKKEVSLDSPVMKTTQLDMLAEPETTLWPSERVRDCLEKDPEGLFEQKHVRGHPKANFRAIALLYLEGKSWKEIAVAVGIPTDKSSTVQTHFRRSCRYFAPNFQNYLQQGDDEE